MKERAADLWQREQADIRWKKLIADLRRASSIHIDETQYVPLRGTTDKARAG